VDANYAEASPRRSVDEGRVEPWRRSAGRDVGYVRVMAGEQKIVVLGPRGGLGSEVNLKEGRLADVRECLVTILTEEGVEVIDSPTDSGPEFTAAVTLGWQRGTVVSPTDQALYDAFMMAGIDDDDYDRPSPGVFDHILDPDAEPDVDPDAEPATEE
jgi:hypothetical protein